MSHVLVSVKEPLNSCTVTEHEDADATPNLERACELSSLTSCKKIVKAEKTTRGQSVAAILGCGGKSARKQQGDVRVSVVTEPQLHPLYPAIDTDPASLQAKLICIASFRRHLTANSSEQPC